MPEPSGAKVNRSMNENVVTFAACIVWGREVTVKSARHWVAHNREVTSSCKGAAGAWGATEGGVTCGAGVAAGGSGAGVVAVGVGSASI